MGSQNQKSGQKKMEQTSEIDIVSEVLQQQPSSIKARTVEAIRISQGQRKMQQQQNEQQIYQKSEIEAPEDLCKLPRVQTIRQAAQQKSIVQGILFKQQPSIIIKQFTQRYCFLTQKKFIYHETHHKSSNRAGTLNFDLLSCYVEVESKNNQIERFKIKVDGCTKQFVFSYPQQQVSENWVKNLVKVTQNSFGRIHSLTYLSHYHRFWRKDYFSQRQFRQKAQTGDIILMRGMAQSAVIQRTITQQQYDHIALVLRNIKGQILLFQANGAVGVGIMPWHRFISKGHYKQQQIVVFRKLKVERTKQFYEQFEEFVQRNMGRKYKFSVQKYLMNRQSLTQDKKSYFCSSLVAKLYKNLQLLNEKISSTQYMPHSFTEKEGLNLRQDGKFGPAKLSKQHIIVFQKLFFSQE